MERHVQPLLDNLARQQEVDALDQIDRFWMDAGTDVFFGESAETLTAERQPVREAMDEMCEWNTKRTLLG